MNLITDQIGNHNFAVIGSSDMDFAAAFRISSGGHASLQFEAVQNQLPVVMKDNEGNLWDIFGYAVEGPREGERLTAARSYTGYWFAWADFFPGLNIYEGHLTE